MKKLLSEPAENAKEAEEERRLQLSETFRTADFHDLVDRTHANVSHVTAYNRIYALYDSQSKRGHFPVQQYPVCLCN